MKAMVEFLKSYGIWIVMGVLFLIMLRGHAHGGGGCCGGGHQHDHEEPGKKDGQSESGKSNSSCH